MKNAGKSTKITRSVPDARKDRRSATGMSGSPKKGGHGGKFTWSGDGYSLAEMGVAEKKAVVVDANDPNFEEPEENAAVADS